jgi:acyl-coenzyme A synthetase/AMP-(fatty) acid ligase
MEGLLIRAGVRGSHEAPKQHAKTVTAPYKYPRKIEFVEDLPKTISGKIRRIELRNREWGRSRG